MKLIHSRKISGSIALLLLVLAFSSCGINSNLMFKIPKGSESSDSTRTGNKYYQLYPKDSIPLQPKEDYRISRDDKFIFTLSSNEGQRILENMSGVNAQATVTNNNQQLEYVVRSDGKSKLPVIGDVHIEGLTVRACQDTLMKLYAAHYHNPFIQMKITNQRVIVFPGNGGDAKVVLLNNNNTTLMEVIAQAGGITERGKANSVKLMRSINGKRQVYSFDLSTIDGLIFADMIVQANDYIYIEPNPKLGREALAQAAPFVTILSSVLILFTVFNNLK